MGDALALSPANAATLEAYYASVNTGDFMGVVSCLSPDIVFAISGNRELLPFAGRWEGIEAVKELFGAFGSAFRIVEMSETRTISDADQVFSFNDEAFKVNSTGVYYRVPVVHHITFADGLITMLHNIHDTKAAEQAFAGQGAVALPILTGSLAPGESEVSPEQAKAVTAALLEAWVDPEAAGGLLAEDAQVLAPGSADSSEFAGVWLGREECVEFLRRLGAAVGTGPVSVKATSAVAGACAVAASQPTAHGEAEWIALVQVGSDGMVHRVALYLDTPPL